MAGLIKGGYGYGFGYINNSSKSEDEEPVMKTVYGKPPAENPSALKSPELPKKKPQEQKPAPKKAEAEEEETVSDEAINEETSAEQEEDTTVSAEEARIERAQLLAEYEAMRDKYEKQSEMFVMRAKEKASEVYEKTKSIATQTVMDARDEAEKIKKEAAEEAEARGYEEGLKRGYDDGYMKALKKCKESLLELKELSEEVAVEKNEIYMQFERQLFDTIFEIAQKVTLNSLAQKDKGVITKMIREAGKKYKTSKSVKIMLSKLDISETAEIDEQLLSEVFKGTENVEIELTDSPQGTLIIDDGSEITDASVSTQLKMIEQLGKGKYRDKSFGDILQEKKPRKTRKKADDSEAENTEADIDDVPDVVYSTGKNQEDE